MLDDRIIVIDTDTTITTRSGSLVPSKSFNLKKRDSNAKVVQAFLSETNGNNNSKNKLVPDNSKALVAARGGRDMKRISINLDQVDVIGVNSNDTAKLNEKRNSIANKDLNMIENSSYYGIRNEKLVKILHK